MPTLGLTRYDCLRDGDLEIPRTDRNVLPLTGGVTLSDDLIMTI
jgi:hypothetical protein